MRALSILALLTVTACAPSGAGTGAHPQTVRIVGGTGQLSEISTVTSSDAPPSTRVRSSVDDVWKALPEIYQALSIPVARVDAAARVIGNPGLRARRQLGGVPLTRYFDCGRTQGGPSAETYELHISVLTQVREDEPGSTAVSTSVQATGRPVNFASESVRCSTTGALERRIAEALQVRALG